MVFVRVADLAGIRDFGFVVGMLRFLSLMAGKWGGRCGRNIECEMER
jgi:hypothetical protein